jgi:hypothetical protein
MFPNMLYLLSVACVFVTLSVPVSLLFCFINLREDFGNFFPVAPTNKLHYFVLIQAIYHVQYIWTIMKFDCFNSIPDELLMVSNSNSYGETLVFPMNHVPALVLLLAASGNLSCLICMDSNRNDDFNSIQDDH